MTALIYILLVLLALLTGLHLWTLSLARKAEQAVPRAGQVLRVPGGAIHYVELGPADGQPVVMIHGLSAQLQNFTCGLSDLLQDDFRLILVDRPGSGYSRRDRAADADLGAQARMLGALFDDLGLTRPVLVGHSLGGALSLRLALERPDRIGALALLAPLTQIQNDIAPIFRPLKVRSGLVRWLIGNTISAPMGQFSAAAILAQAFAPDPVPADFMIRGGAVLGLRPDGFIVPSQDLMALETAMPQQIARYGELRVPGGILYGADDALLSPDVHGAPMRAFGLTLEVLPGRGHMLPITAPEDCARFIRSIAEATR